MILRVERTLFGRKPGFKLARLRPSSLKPDHTLLQDGDAVLTFLQIPGSASLNNRLSHRACMPFFCSPLCKFSILL
jgi:hypothetical protein